VFVSSFAWMSCEHTVDVAQETITPLPPCDPAIINFETQIQPILSSSCAVPGCHDSETPAVYIDLSNYEATMNSKVLGEPIVLPGDPENSRIYRVLRGYELIFMPPPYNYQIKGSQKVLIRKWIEQGAQNSEPCLETDCDTTQYDWSTTIRPIIDTYCRGCHFKDYPAAGIALDFHFQVQEAALEGLLYQSVAGIAPARAMPLDKPIPECKKIQIKKWIDNGAPRD